MSTTHDAHDAPKHPYHLVDPSPWPIIGALSAGLIARRRSCSTCTAARSG